jgi:hypothetical protein
MSVLRRAVCALRAWWAARGLTWELLQVCTCPFCGDLIAHCPHGDQPPKA